MKMLCLWEIHPRNPVRYSELVIFTKWVSCDGCKHWIHLIYVTNVWVVRRGDAFFCPNCSPEE